jgi:omega-6 fatty acid desaturase (delta-12 desaturase)
MRAESHAGELTHIDARALMRPLARYRDPILRRSLIEIAVTALPLLLVWTAMWAALDAGMIWLYLALVIPGALLLVRLFMIQHDCGHGAFFRTRRANDWVGRVISVLTLTPYDYWRRTHAAHHAGSGNLDRRGMGDIDTLTVREYQALSRFGRLRYRIYRNPVVMFGIGPAYLFLLQNRIPSGLVRAGWQPWASAMATNAAIALLAAGAMWLVGVKEFLLLYLPVTVLASSIGVWLFYVQHQFEDTVWAKDPAWMRTRRLYTAARITTCRASCAGSPRISACIMCTTWQAASPITGSRRYSTTTRN